MTKECFTLFHVSAYMFSHLERGNFLKLGPKSLPPSLLFLPPSLPPSIPSFFLLSILLSFYIDFTLFYFYIIYIFIWISHLFIVSELQVFLLVTYSCVNQNRTWKFYQVVVFLCWWVWPNT